MDTLCHTHEPHWLRRPRARQLPLSLHEFCPTFGLGSSFGKEIQRNEQIHTTPFFADTAYYLGFMDRNHDSVQYIESCQKKLARPDITNFPCHTQEKICIQNSEIQFFQISYFKVDYEIDLSHVRSFQLLLTNLYIYFMKFYYSCSSV